MGQETAIDIAKKRYSTYAQGPQHPGKTATQMVKHSQTSPTITCARTFSAPLGVKERHGEAQPRRDEAKCSHPGKVDYSQILPVFSRMQHSPWRVFFVGSVYPTKTSTQQLGIPGGRIPNSAKLSCLAPLPRNIPLPSTLVPPAMLPCGTALFPDH